ncbi:MAG: HEAT repeat domain-containing protein [Gemmataceae bacterium]|nr:HEAT repeat domain-containing protein [Gemmataceae bacterium]MCI0738501.1 HEAT repeat domain-containing protein [Gemmataceae bacterium]
MKTANSAIVVSVALIASTILGQTESKKPREDPIKLETDDAKNLKRARQLLGQMQKVVPGVRELRALLRDKESEETRFVAACALEELGPSSFWAVSRLANDGLFDSSARVRAKSADALAQIGPRAQSTVPDLVLALRDKDIKVRRRVAVALGAIRSQPDIAVPALVKALFDEDCIDGQEACVRTAAMRAISHYGPAAKAAQPTLLKIVIGEQGERRKAAIGTLGQIKEDLPTLIPFLRNILNDPEQEEYRAAAAGAIGAIGSEARAAIPDLLIALMCRDLVQPARADGIRAAVLSAFGRIRSDDNLVVPAVLAIACNKNLEKGIRREAILTLGKIGPGAKAAIPSLIQLLNDDEYVFFAQDISKAFQGIGKDAVQPLMNNLTIDHGLRRARTIDALGLMGPLARDAIPLLKAELSNPEFQSTASLAIRAIERKLKYLSEHDRNGQK